MQQEQMASAMAEGWEQLVLMAPTTSTRDGTKPEIQPLLGSCPAPESDKPQAPNTNVKDDGKAVAQRRPDFGLCNWSGKMSGRGGLSHAVNNSWR